MLFVQSISRGLLTLLITAAHDPSQTDRELRGSQMMDKNENRLTMRMGFLMMISWLGMMVHNRVELPGMPLYRPEYLVPTIISLGLFLGWWRQGHSRRVWAWLILFWTALHLIGGAILSVLPLAILPFDPEQSLGHYASHVFYGLAQLPLIWVVGRSLVDQDPRQRRTNTENPMTIDHASG